jgi:hypothetical protein
MDTPMKVGIDEKTGIAIQNFLDSHSLSNIRFENQHDVETGFFSFLEYLETQQPHPPQQLFSPKKGKQLHKFFRIRKNKDPKDFNKIDFLSPQSKKKIGFEWNVLSPRASPRASPRLSPRISPVLSPSISPIVSPISSPQMRTFDALQKRQWRHREGNAQASFSHSPHNTPHVLDCDSLYEHIKRIMDILTDMGYISYRLSHSLITPIEVDYEEDSPNHDPNDETNNSLQSLNLVSLSPSRVEGTHATCSTRGSHLGIQRVSSSTPHDSHSHEKLDSKDTSKSNELHNTDHSNPYCSPRCLTIQRTQQQQLDIQHTQQIDNHSDRVIETASTYSTIFTPTMNILNPKENELTDFQNHVFVSPWIQPTLQTRDCNIDHNANNLRERGKSDSRPPPRDSAQLKMDAEITGTWGKSIHLPWTSPRGPIPFERNDISPKKDSGHRSSRRLDSVHQSAFDLRAPANSGITLHESKSLAKLSDTVTRGDGSRSPLTLPPTKVSGSDRFLSPLSFAYSRQPKIKPAGSDISLLPSSFSMPTQGHINKKKESDVEIRLSGQNSISFLEMSPYDRLSLTVESFEVSLMKKFISASIYEVLFIFIF